MEAGGRDVWQRVMDESAALHEQLRSEGHDSVAPYAVAMAYRVRFYMEMNAREAMHVIELRSAPQGHPAYRRVCQRMHTLIAEQAGHRAIADAMRFTDHSEVALERLNAERALEARRARTPRTIPPRILTPVFTHQLEVRFRDCDPMGHVNNAVYLTYLEEAASITGARPVSRLPARRRPMRPCPATCRV